MTNATAKLEALVRETSGTGSARALRREGKTPATLYAKGQQPMSIALSAKELRLEYQKGRFRSRLVNLALAGGETVQALPKDVQFHPVTDAIEHVDFIKVQKDSKVRVLVPVKFAGQEKSAGLKRGGVLNIVRHEIEFLCAPHAIPHFIEIDVKDMDIGDSIHINAVKLPEGAVPTIKRNFTIATIAGRKAEEEPKPEAAAAAASAEGTAAAPAAGDAKKAEPAKKDEKK